MGKKKKKKFVQNPGNSAICYYRYSSDAQRGCSIEQQMEGARDYADRKGLNIIKEYKDRAVSGRTTINRDDYQLMFQELQTLRPAYLIVWTTDRLGRDKEEIVFAKYRLRKAGVKIEYVAEVVPEEDTSRIIMESMLEALAETYSINLSKNVLRGLNYNAERALYNGILIFGYVGEKDKPYRIDEKSAEIVRQIFEEYADGKPKQTICDDLNRRGIRTVRDKEFTVNSLSHILANDTYLGIYKFGDYRIEGGMPRIIDDELFARVQERIQKNKRGGKGAIKKLNPDAAIAEYLLTGKLFCKECGSPMTGSSGTGKGGNLFYYYSCSGRRKKKCTMKNKPKELLERITLRVLQDLLGDATYRFMLAEKIYFYYQSQNNREPYIASLKARLNETDKKLKNIMKAIENGIFNDTTADRMHELEEQKMALQEEIEVEENRQKYELTFERILRFLDTIFGEIDNAERFTQIMDMFIAKIYVTLDDKMIFLFYYSDDQREVDIKDMEEALDRNREINEIMNLPNKDDFLRKKKKRDDGGDDPHPF